MILYYINKFISLKTQQREHKEFSKNKKKSTHSNQQKQNKKIKAKRRHKRSKTIFQFKENIINIKDIFRETFKNTNIVSQNHSIP